MLTEPTTKNGARFIAETLHQYGVTHVFYVDAILRKAMVELEELGIKRIIVHSEKAAAYMADGYARISGRPGICMAQSVGAANLAAALQDPFLAGSPVIAFTGKKPPIAQYRNAYQEIDHTPLFDPVTKYNVNVIQIEQLPFLMRQAFREATSGKPGPVHLDLIGREARELEVAEARISVSVDSQFLQVPAFRIPPEVAYIEEAAKRIQAAERPVIVAGGGVRLSDAAGQVVTLAEKCQIPVVTSVNGKGSIPEDHPLSAGVMGTYSMECANRIVHEADLVIFIGSSTGDQTTNLWRIPAQDTSIIQIDIEPYELGRNYPGTLAILADAQTGLHALIEALPDSSGNPAWLQQVAEWVNATHATYEPLRQSDAVPIRPERICKEITDMLPENAIVVSDTGYSAIWTATMLRITKPGQTFIRAAGSLGWAFPASLGAKCAAPDRPVITFTGDGGFWYHFGELETARRMGIHTVTVVNNNGGFSQGIPDIQRQYQNRSGNPQELYEFEKDISFAKLAQDMGCFGIRVDHPSAISPALQAALHADLPAVVEIMTDFSARAPEPWSP
jgi:acetolactate synthase-1/2/3 large subunit